MRWQQQQQEREPLKIDISRKKKPEEANDVIIRLNAESIGQVD